MRDLFDRLHLPKKNLLRRVIIHVVRVSNHAECPMGEAFAAIEARKVHYV